MRAKDYIKKTKQIAQGKKSRDLGKYYEKVFEAQVHRAGGTALRIEDAAKVIPMRGMYSRGRPVGSIVRYKQPFDFIVGIDGQTIVCDIKSTKNKNLTFSYINQVLKEHQRSALTAMSAHCTAGIVVFFHELDFCMFYKIGIINSLTKGSSLKPQDGLMLGNSLQLDIRLAL